MCVRRCVGVCGEGGVCVDMRIIQLCSVHRALSVLCIYGHMEMSF